MTLREKYLKTSDDAKKEKKISYTVRKDKKKLETAIIVKEEEIDTLTQNLLDRKSNMEFDIDQILKAKDDLDLALRDLEVLTTLLLELFNDKFK